MAEKICNNCNTKRKAPESVPYMVHEEAMVRNERNVRRIVVALVVSIALIFASNACWLYAWCQYDYYGEEIIIEQDAQDGGNANYIGNDGDIINGEAKDYHSEAGEN